MIAAIYWVPKGASKSVLALADSPSKQEIEEILKSDTFKIRNDNGNNEENHNMDFYASKQDDEVFNALAAADALSKASNSSNLETDGLTDALNELDKDNYDEEDDGVELFSSGLGNLYYPSNDMDPYLKNQNDDDSEEEVYITINPEDAIIICARNEDDVCHLEACDLMTGFGLLKIPLQGISTCMYTTILSSQLFYFAQPGLIVLSKVEKSNLIAVGSMEPAIEIRDLDIIYAVRPAAALGGVIEKKKAKKKSVIKYKDGSHTDSVLGLAWNEENRNILAIASADKLVKIRDVAAEKCDITMDHHTDEALGTTHAPETFVIHTVNAYPRRATLTEKD